MWVDSIQRRLKRPAKRRRFPKLAVLLLAISLVLVSGLVYFGRSAADYLLDEIKPISLFGSGKFLVLFQNNAEIRSSGVFIGSFAVAEIENFQIKNLNFNTNINALDRSFTDQYYVESPRAMAKFLKGQSWSLKDSNYDASFPEAAKDILYFYQAETGDAASGI